MTISPAGMRQRFAWLILFFPLLAHAFGSSGQPTRYTISLAQAATHIVGVRIQLPPGASTRDLQLPVWNALYQVRDFSQYVGNVRGTDNTGHTLPTRKLDKSRWRLEGADNGATIEYETYANNPGPYDAQLDSHHAFFNLAQILMYSVELRASPIELRFIGIPKNWRIATALDTAPDGAFTAENYDRLVDSPVEVSEHAETDFEQDGARYRIVVHAAPGDYDLQKIAAMVRKIVAAETAWMNDRPFQTFLFIYHFPRVPGGGGMEHAYSTAIDANAQTIADDPLALAGVTAHEFFHLWNVKRIRPQGLEPIDYSKENYTTALWFSEGFADTVEDYALLQAGLIDERQYLLRLAATIAEIELSPAHRTQSAEESSLDAWLEKYDYYRTPQRSISYYKKGELLGVMLDLTVRDASHGTASLRNVFQWMNLNYAKQGRPFPESNGVRQAAEAVSHADLEWFFQKYVAATTEIPWDDFLRGVGLRLSRETNAVADPGFSAVRNFNNPPTVVTLRPGSEAEKAGLALGDSILELNDRAAGSDFEERLARLQPGESLRLQVRRGQNKRELRWKLESREGIQFELKDVDGITPAQKARRAAWLKGESQKPGDPQP